MSIGWTPNRSLRGRHHGEYAVQGGLYHDEHEDTVQRDKLGLRSRGEETAVSGIDVHLPEERATAHEGELTSSKSLTLDKAHASMALCSLNRDIAC